MIYKSMDDLRNLSDKEVEEFLKKYWKAKDFEFYGKFTPNTKTPENYCGIMSKVKVPGSSIWLKYPFMGQNLVSFKVPSNQKLDGKYYKFDCRLLPNYNNRCQLQILLNTLQEIDHQTYMGKTDSPHFESKPKYESKPMSPLAHRYQILEDEETGWGKDIKQLMGVYRMLHDGTCCIDDIRRTDFTELSNYPKTTFRVGPLHLSHPIEGLEDGQYCLFNWKFTFKVKINPCEIEVDEDKPIVFVDNKDFISHVQQSIDNHEASATSFAPQSDVCVLLYDLMHEANKYTGTSIDVQFHLTDKYLSFQHTGRPLTQDRVLSLCGLKAWSPDYQNDNIAYHCNGLREFLLSNKRTIISSGSLSVRFDSADGQIRPSILEKDDVSRDIKISLAKNKKFTETIILPFDEKGSATSNNFKVGLHCIFDDVQNIAFFANIGKVSIKIKGGKTKNLDRSDWTVSKEYLTFIPKEIRQKIDATNTKSASTDATSQNIKKHTSIMFACRTKGNVLCGEDDAPVYCLLPTTTTFGFPFLMSMDIQINKTNYAISRKSIWNKAYAEMAGRLFAKWITDLTQKAEFTPKSIYGIVPKFDRCIKEHPEEKAFIELFEKGFKDIILKEDEPEQPKEAESVTKPEAEKKSKGRTPKARHAKGNGKLYVIDTNIFVNCPDIISKMGSNDTIILSAKVVDELDNLKYKMEDKDLRNVQKALKNINMALDKENVHMEMSDVRLLPRDFDRHNPDNSILSVLIRYKDESPTLLTSDNGLQIKAKALGINVIGLKDFLAHRDNG